MVKYTSSNRINSRSDACNILRPDTRKGNFLMNPHSTPAPYFPANLDDYALWVAKHGLIAPYGKCQCMCGKAVALSKKNDTRSGYTRGEPVRFFNSSHSRHQLTLEQAFWQYATPGDPNECWEWQKVPSSNGYGIVRYRGQRIPAHRVSWEIHFGPIPDGLFVLHKCDNRRCVNPYHLFLGTHQDNMDDMNAKGRRLVASGERCGSAKLTQAKVNLIRDLYKEGMTQRGIARQFGVRPDTIWNIVNNRTWKRQEI